MSIHDAGKMRGLLYRALSLELDELAHWFDHLSAAASNAPSLRKWHSKPEKGDCCS
jgi:hypothetical protein